MLSCAKLLEVIMENTLRNYSEGDHVYSDSGEEALFGDV